MNVRPEDLPLDHEKGNSSALNDCAGGRGITLSVAFLSLLLVVITLFVYWQVTEHEFLNYDDNSYITENSHVAKGLTGANIIWSFTSVYAANWHPVTWLSHMADAHLFGMNSGGHHLTSVFIHAVSAMLLFLLLFRLTRAVWQSLFVAALFALHPLHVQSVAWVAERKDVLSAFFCFLTLLLYAAYAERRKTLTYLLALISYVCGLMSKPMLVTLPFVMLLIDFWPLGRYQSSDHDPGRQQNRKQVSRLPLLIREKVPFFACSLVSTVITIYAQHKGGAIIRLEELPVSLRIANAITAYLKYITKAFWPRELALIYPFPTTIPLWQVLSSLLILICISAAAIRFGRRHPYLPVGWFWFLVTLLPVIGIIQIGSQSMADRYTYIPLIGLFIMATWAGAALAKGLHWRQRTIGLVAGVVILTATALTWQQLGYWRDSASLYRHAHHVTTGNYIICNNLGIVLAEKGEIDAAISEFYEALQINPNYADAHYNFGNVLTRKGNLPAAIHEYREALRINPGFINAHNNLGHVLAKQGNLEAATREYQTALRINPDFIDAHINLGYVLAKQGNLEAAIAAYKTAITLNPQCSDAHYNLGNVFARKGQLDAAIKEYTEVLTINPDYLPAHNNLRVALALKKDY